MPYISCISNCTNYWHRPVHVTLSMRSHVGMRKQAVSIDLSVHNAVDDVSMPFNMHILIGIA